MKTNVIFKTLMAIFVLSSLSFTLIQKPMGNMDDGSLEDFLLRHEKELIPLYKNYATAYWNAAVSGRQQDYQRAAEAELTYSMFYANRDNYEFLKGFKTFSGADNQLLKRQVEVVLNAYTAKQIDEGLLNQMVELSSQIDQRFNTFRANVNGDEITDNELENILKTSKDVELLEAVWRSSKQVGTMVAPELLQLVTLRNDAARLLGYRNYHEMSLILSEQDPIQIDNIFKELDGLTRDAYMAMKDSIDQYLATFYGIEVQELMPWHFQNRFFQEAPKIYDLDLNKYYKTKDITTLTLNYFKSIGLDISDMMTNSDLHEKPGKNQHAFCLNMNKQGDVRVLCNIKPTYYWMNTTLHEFGHAVYEKYIDPALPFVLRDPAHAFTTEAVAMLFGRLAANPRWLKDMGLITESERQKIHAQSQRMLRMEQLVFSRWAQVMYHFEKALYENPEGNLNDLWWELVHEYQLLNRPHEIGDGEWASKVHLALFPCYYHNYLLGEVLASQLHYYISESILRTDDIHNQSYFNKKEVGNYLKDYVFSPGNLYPWPEMVRRATKQDLTPKYYVMQFVGR